MRPRDVPPKLTPRPKAMTARIMAGAAIGNALEWYDFTVYILFAGQIGRAMFATDTAAASLIKALILFGVGFVARPLGAIVIGRYGDRAGRKAAPSLTIMLMLTGTFFLTTTPDYATIGVGAPMLILLGRALQGFSVGGELSSAAAFLVEHAPLGRKNAYASILHASMAASNILSATVALLITTCLTSTQVDAWGWRIPFVLGLAIAPIGLWLRKALEETPDFFRCGNSSRKEAFFGVFALSTRRRLYAASAYRSCGQSASIRW